MCASGAADVRIMRGMTRRRPVECWLTDMDGVLVHEERAIPGAADFIAALVENGCRFQILTNNSIYTARDLRARLKASAQRRRGRRD